MKAIDIWSRGDSPARELSNFYPHAFVIDGVACGSMEGFLQSLKFKSRKKQTKICALVGKEAKLSAKRKWLWKLTGRLFWQGRVYKRRSGELRELILCAYALMYEQSAAFREALDSTRGMTLTHTMGKSNPRFTVLTEAEFISALISVRDGKK